MMDCIIRAAVTCLLVSVLALGSAPDVRSSAPSVPPTAVDLPSFRRIPVGAAMNDLDTPAQREAAFARAYAALKRAMAEATSVEVFQGLPRQGAKNAPTAERPKVPLRFDDQDFYPTAHPLSEQQQIELSAVLIEPTFAPYQGIKLCGGFHADYAVRWTWNKGESATLLLLCFGCHEARVLSGGRETIDIVAAHRPALRSFFGSLPVPGG